MRSRRSRMWWCLGWLSLSLAGCGSSTPEIELDGGSGDGGQSQPDGGMNVDAGLDAAPTPLGLDDCFADVPEKSPDGSRQIGFRQWAALDDSLQVRVALDTMIGPTGLLTADVYRFGLARGSGVVCVRDLGAMAYHPSHHNWNDRVSATQGSTRYEVEMNYEFPFDGDWSYRLVVYEGDAPEPQESIELDISAIQNAASSL